MELDSALKINATKFGSAAIPDEAHEFNNYLMDLMSKGPKWYEVGAPKHRQMRIDGQTPLPKPRYLDSAEDFDIPSRDAGRAIPCRLLRPQNGPARAVYLHFHSGGWVLGDQKTQDMMLQDIANRTNTLAFSVGYRHAPEDPFPAGPNDCYDAAQWLVDNAESTLEVPLGFCGGESAGAHLGFLVMLHLLQSPEAKYAGFRFKGMILNFGCYSLSWLPSMHHFKKPKTLILDRQLMDEYVKAFLPGMSEEEKKHPSVSPLYADLEPLRGKLPPAIFTVGTEDCLMDDTILMSAKYMMAGGEATVKVVPGAAHAYITFSREVKGTGADEGLTAVEAFMRSQLN
ncbi:hypothetical protein CkaCkLH20_12748 [Colletotrichum karsti]|uniref:Alpha/beta hydrolase fold-3 domain-containing protein n=1 Tax=Colletotrichum karsti TaxID=1095194 RepID=A0A9P6HTL3_9PEZI|nr:uncharacterized protein CkaCkLH20_12748 [Colletotrichum karsti]KAF9869705.1 hypothetical protein CkaCkLH20_12748 [Colletotrichum karsti]